MIGGMLDKHIVNCDIEIDKYIASKDTRFHDQDTTQKITIIDISSSLESKHPRRIYVTPTQINTLQEWIIISIFIYEINDDRALFQKENK